MSLVWGKTQRYLSIPKDIALREDLRLLPATVGECRSLVRTIGEGLTLITSDYKPVRPLIEQSCYCHDRPMLVMTFALCGNSLFRSDNGAETRFSEGQVTITSFMESRGERHFAAGQQVNQLRLLLSADCLRQYLGSSACEQLFARSTIVNHAYTPYGHAAAQVLTQLQQTGENTLNRHIYALKLLALHRHLLDDVPVKLRDPEENQRLDHACEWMAAHLDAPISMGMLAMSVGLSEYRLKQGFHRRFNTTPGKMLLMLRMERAHVLLEEGYQVAQAGWRVGYRHANNFSVAFFRYYGRQASSVAGKKQ